MNTKVKAEPKTAPSSQGAVWIERVGNHIHAQIPYWDGNGPEYAKSIAGSSWSKTIRRWTYPLDLQVCRDFREIFKGKLEIGPELWLWAMTARGHEDAINSVKTLTDVDLSLVGDVAPLLSQAIATRPYQKVGARFIADGGNVLIADQPGLGKTLETIAGLIETSARTVLIFAPKTAIESVWKRELERWIPNVQVFVPMGSKTARNKTITAFQALYAKDVQDEQMKVLVCNTEMVRIRDVFFCGGNGCDGKDLDCADLSEHGKYKERLFPALFEIRWDAVVSDESHMALLGRKTQTREGFITLDARARIALSGTPYRGKIENFWGVLNWLNPAVFTSYWKWVNSYFEVTNNGYGTVIGPLLPHRIEAYNRMVSPYVLRRTKSEVAPDLPAKMYAGTPLDPSNPESTVGIWLTMSDKQYKSYAQMNREALAQIDDGELTANGILSELTRLKQFSSTSWRYNEDKEGNQNPIPIMPSNKFDWLLDFMEERKGTDAKVVVASQYTSIVNLFAREMAEKGHPSYVLTGETKSEDRAKVIAKFQDPSDPVQLFFLNTKAGGVAITLDAADELVFIDETYIPDDQEQVEDRIHRVSRIHPVTIYYLRSLGTVEESICAITGAREAVIKGQLDGSRGVEIARKLLGG